MILNDPAESRYTLFSTPELHNTHRVSQSWTWSIPWKLLSSSATRTLPSSTFPYPLFVETILDPVMKCLPLCSNMCLATKVMSFLPVRAHLKWMYPRCGHVQCIISLHSSVLFFMWIIPFRAFKMILRGKLDIIETKPIFSGCSYWFAIVKWNNFPCTIQRCCRNNGVFPSFIPSKRSLLWESWWVEIYSACLTQASPLLYKFYPESYSVLVSI